MPQPLARVKQGQVTLHMHSPCQLEPAWRACSACGVHAQYSSDARDSLGTWSESSVC